MSDADIKANISVSSDVEQATKKTAKDITSFQSQIEAIQKKFSMAGKDIFLGFFAPMALLQGVMGMISQKIEEARQNAKEGVELIAKGETKFASSEEAKMAQFIKAKEARDKEIEQVRLGKQDIADKWLRNTEEGRKLADQIRARGGATASFATTDLAITDEVQKAALKAFLASKEGAAFKPIFEGKVKDSFKAPEGFSNVVGVGANPVLQAMDEALTESKKQTGLLEQIATKQGVYEDFTKKDGSAYATANNISSI